MLAAVPPRPVPPRRSRTMLERQKTDIALVLRSAFTPEDAASASLVAARRGELRGSRTPRRRSARYEAVVDAVVSRLPQHLVAHLPAAVHRLPAEERLAAKLVLTLGHAKAAVAAALGRDVSTIARRVDAGLTRLALALYDEHGHPRPPAAAPFGGHASGAGREG